MHKIKIGVVTLVLASVAMMAPTAHASDLVLVPSIGYGLSTLKFNRSTAVEDKSSFNTVDLGLTAAYKRFYVRFNTEMPLTSDYNYGSSLIRQVKREDWGMVGGFYLLDSLSLFTGVSYGKTSIIDLKGSPVVGTYTTYTDTGPFIGANYQFNIGKQSTIGLNVAFAVMNGELAVNSTDGSVNTKDTGTTGGFSLGASWNSKYGESANYYVALKLKSYKSELTSLTIQKDISILSFGVVFPL